MTQLEGAENKMDSHYGIHILKFLAIFFQIEVHAFNWLSNQMQASAQTFSSAWEIKLLLAKGGFSTLVPITAAAVLRMGLPLAKGQNRLPVDFNLRPYYLFCFFLMFIESVKQSLVYGPWGFFSWNALHLIAATFLVILLILRHSIWILWAIAAGIFALTPLVTSTVDYITPFESSFWPYLSANVCFFFVLTIAAVAATWMYYRNKNIERTFKKRGYVLIASAWFIGLALCALLPQRLFGQDMILMLPQGILAGTLRGNHIWGLFPWAGMTILGFLAYDILLRLNASKLCRWAMALVGAILICVFYIYFSDEVMDNCSGQRASLGFSGLCFNRTPIQILLTVGIFFIATPLSVWAEELGLESRFVRAVSKSILWIYIYETSVLIWLAPLWIKYVPENDRVYSYTLFALISSALLAVLFERSRFSLSVTLKRNEK